MLRCVVLVMLLAAPARAEAPFAFPKDPAAAAFVRSNLIATFYHEMGHGLIDILDLAVPGREEDAADSLSALMIDRFWSEDAAVELTRNTAAAFVLFDRQTESDGSDQAYWDTHSLDLQRYDNLVCLFYGASPEVRAGLADELGLPEQRRESCPEEYQQASDSWGAMLDGMPPQDHGPGLRLVGPADRNPLTALIAEEIEALNGEYGLPVFVDVTVETCGEANAFYDPRARRIVICEEYAEELARLFAADKEASKKVITP